MNEAEREPKEPTDKCPKSNRSCRAHIGGEPRKQSERSSAGHTKLKTTENSQCDKRFGSDSNNPQPHEEQRVKNQDNGNEYDEPNDRDRSITDRSTIEAGIKRDTHGAALISKTLTNPMRSKSTAGETCTSWRMDPARTDLTRPTAIPAGNLLF